MPRYRLPVDAVLLPFAALAVYELAQRAVVLIKNLANARYPRNGSSRLE